PRIVSALSARAVLEREPAVAGALALSLGRLPYLTREEIVAARAALLALARVTDADPAEARNAARGLELQLRAGGRRFPPDGALVARLRETAIASSDEATRRHALGALL